MQYLSVKEVAKKWGYSDETIRKWCREGLITITAGAEKKSGRWQIPRHMRNIRKKIQIREI